MKSSAAIWMKKLKCWFITKIITVLILITGYTTRVRKINKTEIIRHLTTIRKQSTEELNSMIHAFKTNASVPRQVTGDDRVEGNYNPHGTEDYNRTK